MTYGKRLGARLAWLVCMLLFVSIWLGCQRSEAKENLPPASGSGAPPPPNIPVVSSAVSAGGIRGNDAVVVTGSTRPIREAKVGPRGSGVISAMPVEEGDQVKKGQLLFRLEATDQALAVAQAKAALASAMIGENAAKLDFDRQKTLFDSGSVPRAAFEDSQTRYDAAKAAVNQARAAVDRAMRATADTVVHSPITGVIGQRHSNIGDTVTMMPPTVVMVIQDISTLEVRASVPETMLSKIETGSPLTVRFLALGQERSVKIARINPSVNPMTRTVEVVAHVPNEDRALRAGMLVELDFGTLKHDEPPAGKAATDNAPVKP